MPAGSLIMLENLRFNASETSSDDMKRGYFADQLAAPVDLYVGDVPGSAFGHVCSEGGASLEFIQGKAFPGLAALAAP